MSSTWGLLLLVYATVAYASQAAEDVVTIDNLSYNHLEKGILEDRNAGMSISKT